MALTLQISAETEITVPLVCDPAVQAANPPRADGSSPTIRYLVTGDPEGLVIPEGASHATIRALTRDELRQTEAAIGRRYSDRGRRVYSRVVDEMDRRARGADTAEVQRRDASVDAVAAWLAAASDVPADVREGVGRALASEREAIGAAVSAALGPATEAAVLDGLTDEEHGLYLAHCAWLRGQQREIVRRGLVALSDAPGWRRGADGFPVEKLLLVPDVGEALVEEIAGHVLHAATLGKALSPSSGASSGARATCPSTTSAPPATTATDGSPPGSEPRSSAA